MLVAVGDDVLLLLLLLSRFHHTSSVTPASISSLCVWGGG